MLCRSPFGAEGQLFSAEEKDIWKMARSACTWQGELRLGATLWRVGAPDSREFACRHVKGDIRLEAPLAEGMRYACGRGDNMPACRLRSWDISRA